MSNQGFANAHKPSGGSPRTKGWLPEERVLCARTQARVALSGIQHPDVTVPTWEGADYGYYGNYSHNSTCIFHVINGDEQLVC